MKRSAIIHPFLLAIFPVLAFYEYNKYIAELAQAMAPLIVSLGLASVIFFILKTVIKDRRKAALITSLFFISIYLFGHFRTILPNYIFGRSILYNYYILSLVWICLLAFGGLLIATTKKSFEIITTYLNVVSILLCLFPAVNIIIYEHNSSQTLNNVTLARNVDGDNLDQPSKKPLPDIYYIILDKYAGAEILKKYYDYDNSDFLDYLKTRGFYIAASSTTNYFKTEYSLASSLNMEYLDFLDDQLDDSFDKITLISRLLEDYSVERILKTNGYEFIHLGNVWQPTYRNKYADANYNIRLMSNFSWNLYRTTIIFPLLKNFGLDYAREHWQRLLYQFDILKTIPDKSEPTFVFAHLLTPHPPYVFDENGNFLNDSALLLNSEKTNYINQLKFTNQKIMKTVDTILKNSRTAPIIIIQSDHGTGPPILDENPPLEDIYERLPILNAYYLNDAGKSQLYQSITPVNSFRVIFNCLFNAELELLPDRNYLSTRYQPYHFINIETILNEY